MKNLEKGAGITSRGLPTNPRVFVKFLQRKFLHRRKVTKLDAYS